MRFGSGAAECEARGAFPGRRAGLMASLCGQRKTLSTLRGWCGTSALDHIPADGHEVQRAATHHEQVPDAVPVAVARVVYKEHDTGGVDDAARQQPGEALAA